MKIVYMGTPDFAAEALKAIINAGHEVVSVITQPDKAKGRSDKLVFTPVKEVAVANDIPVYQPEKASAPEFIEQLKEIAPDIVVVAAYGQILSEEFLNVPPMGCINIHASLLPKYRGAAPIQNVILNGEEKTGVTIMYMAKGLDTGDMISKAELIIDKKETGGSLHDKLAALGGELIVKTLKDMEAGSFSRTPQNDAESSYVGMIKKEMGHIDFNNDAAFIERQIRAFSPWPSAFAKIKGKNMKMHDAEVMKEEEIAGVQKDCAPGTVAAVLKDRFVIKCGTDYIGILSLQPEGKKQMPAVSYLAGNAVSVGDIFE